MSSVGMEFSTDGEPIVSLECRDNEIVRLSSTTHSHHICCGFNISVVMTWKGDKPVCDLRCRQHRLGEEDKFWVRSVDWGRIDSLVRQLAQSPVPAIPEEILVCDGTEYELTIKRGMNSVVYRWWCEPPLGYEPIGHFANRLEKLGGIKNVG